MENARALQHAVDQGGTIMVSRPGTYKTAHTVYIGSNTSLIFGNGIFIKKVDEQGPFTHVLLNRGALTKQYDNNITVDGLHIIVNGIDVRVYDVYGLHGQLAFFYVKHLRVTRYRCMDIGTQQYGLHICTFEDIIVDDVVVKGDKDGVHLGRGKRFTIRNGIFQTLDDAVALNAHDYSVGNPELGWIEDGVVENCHDLDSDPRTGYFSRIIAGAWLDWQPGMEVQRSDTVVSDGRLYRVQTEPDGTIYTSTTQPRHEHGSAVLDGITWGMVQRDVTYTAGVRNVTFRDIFLEKPRIAFSMHFDNDKWSRSYYPGAILPMQEKIVFDNIRVIHDETTDFLSVMTPVDVLSICNSALKNNRIDFHGRGGLPEYLKTRINMSACVWSHPGPVDLVTNSIDGKEILLKTFASVELNDEFSARVVTGNGSITVESDLTGLHP